MASLCSHHLVVAVIVFLMGCSSSVPTLSTHESTLPTSTISASPAILPYPPLSSPLSSPPSLSPDITPLFPSPGGSAPSPSESSVPTIPSSPSPPNPDEMAAPGPTMADASSPSGSSPPLSSVAVLGSSGSPSSVLFPGLLAFWLAQIYGM
ncbi:hypothetical protein NMG60_11034926 [Bertholletia excelsa]